MTAAPTGPAAGDGPYGAGVTGAPETPRQAVPDGVPARPASTVLVVRDGPTGVEVFMLRRQPTMAFAAGALVFPGGGVDPQDHDPAVPWRGPSAAEWGRTLGLPASAARAHVCAAVRETFEECGVLLATPQDGADPPDPALLAADRRRLITGRTTFGRLLAARGLVLRSDLLRPWAHFVTPGWYPRRYDTRFFLARLPHRQQALHLGGEAAESRWWTPAEALAQGLSGEVLLMDPTRMCLEDLVDVGTVAELVEAPGARR